MMMKETEEQLLDDVTLDQVSGGRLAFADVIMLKLYAIRKFKEHPEYTVDQCYNEILNDIATGRKSFTNYEGTQDEEASHWNAVQMVYDELHQQS